MKNYARLYAVFAGVRRIQKTGEKLLFGGQKMVQMFNLVHPDLGMYEVAMVCLGIVLIVLIALRTHLMNHARYRRSLIPARLAERHAKQAERTVKAKERAARQAQVASMIDRVTPNMNFFIMAALRAPEKSRVRPS